ncbi:hypothetical protein VNI00_013493 [Paramarasmius palmivorus]|uniref:Uncharacterized protein n=1 Tax=Paramarasmius palmivorus TaxID=297713 RepID=A0AAW0BWL7_9AGAR
MSFDPSQLTPQQLAGLSSFLAAFNSPAPTPAQPPLSQPPLSQPPLSQPPLSQPPLSQPPLSQPRVTQAPPSTPPSTQPPPQQQPSSPLGSSPSATFTFNLSASPPGASASSNTAADTNNTVCCPRCTMVFVPNAVPSPNNPAAPQPTPIGSATLANIPPAGGDEFENRWYAIIRGRRIGWVKGDSRARRLVSGAPFNFHRGFSTEAEARSFYEQQSCIPNVVYVTGEPQDVADLVIPPGCGALQ